MTAVRAGADALGFIFWNGSPRCIEPLRARAIIEAFPPFVSTVGVFVNAEPQDIKETAAEAGVGFVQLHGDERPRMLVQLRGLKIIKSVRVSSEADLKKLMLYQVEAYLLDAYSPDKPGGTGKSFDWEIARKAAANGPIIVAGGLTPENVAECVRIARPYAVDVASGVEDEPGLKNKQKVIDFVRNAKSVVLY